MGTSTLLTHHDNLFEISYLVCISETSPKKFEPGTSLLALTLWHVLISQKLLDFFPFELIQ